MFVAPVVYAASNWLDFANYALPDWAGGLGAVLIAGALFVFWRAHADLGLNWSPSLEIREKHELITRGIYGVVRHPMYASQWLWVIGQPLLLQNWVAGWLDLLVFIPFYFLQVRAERFDFFRMRCYKYRRGVVQHINNQTKTGGSMDRHIGLWIDHKQAYVIWYQDGRIEVIPSHIEPPTHYSGGTQLGGKLNQKADTELRNNDRFRLQLNKYYQQVISALKDADSIFIMGPGEAKIEFQKAMKRHKSLQKRLLKVETAGKMTKNQMMAHVRRVFQTGNSRTHHN